MSSRQAVESAMKDLKRAKDGEFLPAQALPNDLHTATPTFNPAIPATLTHSARTLSRRGQRKRPALHRASTFAE